MTTKEQVKPCPMPNRVFQTEDEYLRASAADTLWQLQKARSMREVDLILRHTPQGAHKYLPETLSVSINRGWLARLRDWMRCVT